MTKTKQKVRIIERVYPDGSTEYVIQQRHFLFRRGKWSEEKFGDWEIREVKVLDYSVVEAQRREEEIKERALGKLTVEEMKVLGL